MAIDPNKVMKQANFCLELMQRLNEEIKADKAINKYTQTIWYHSRKRNDIVRVRRELLKLGKMLDPWGEQNDV